MSANKKISSKDQFALDFGCFPPKPLLVSSETDHSFTLKYQSKLSYLTDYIRDLFVLYKHIFRPSARVQIAERALLEHGDNVEALKVTISELKDNISSLEDTWFIKKYSYYALMLGISLLLSVPLILFITYKLLGISLRRLKQFESEYGSVSSLFYEKQTEVKINTNKKYKESNNIEYIVTHEHIHVMQNLHQGIDSVTLFEIQTKPKLASVINTDIEDYKYSFISYLYTDHELEARLQELVLSGYRELGVLPANKLEFICFICRNMDVFSTFDNNDEIIEYCESNISIDFSAYSCRSKEIGSDVFLIFNTLESDEIRMRFISEVLFIMYSNLITYYGDLKLAQQLRAQCIGPNLYDRIFRAT